MQQRRFIEYKYFDVHLFELHNITALSKMTIAFIFTLLMYKLLAVITDDTGQNTGHSTTLRRIRHLAFL
jgi:hypothetical protein